MESDISVCVLNFLDLYINNKYVFLGSCVDFGSSGSGVVREWKKYNEILSVDFGVDYVDGSDTGKKEEHYQYSFVGPLSMSKGCDLSLDIVGKNNKLGNVEFIYRGKWIKYLIQN